MIFMPYVLLYIGYGSYLLLFYFYRDYRNTNMKKNRFMFMMKVVYAVSVFKMPW